MGQSAPATTLGSVIRNIRKRNGWTLKEMSERTGIPLSTISKVEHDRLTLTYDKLQQLGQRLDIPMSELFSEPDSQDATPGPVTGRRARGGLDDAVRVETQNYDYFYLCTELRKKTMVPIFTRIRARSADEFGELVRHAGEEFVFVLDGTVEVHTEFYDPVVLKPGECFYLDSMMGHAYLVGEGCEEATLIAVCAGDDDSHRETLMSLAQGDTPARKRGL